MTATNQEQIHIIIQKWADSLRRKDANGMLSHYAPRLVHFSLAPPLVSTASDEKGLTAWFATWEGAIGYEIHELIVTVAHDVAFSHSLNRMHGTKTNGVKSDLWFRHTFGFQMIDGAWKIAHEHESVPFYMDGSYKAAIDLKP